MAPHSRNKRTGSGSAGGLGRGRRVSGGGPVGGSSQNGRGGFGGSIGSSVGSRSSGGSRGSGSGGAGLLALFAIFALLPKKLRRILLVVLAVVLVFSYISGGFGGSGNIGSSGSSNPNYVNQPAATLPGQGASLFDTSSLFESDDLFGAGSSYSGGSPSGSTDSSGSGGLLQSLPGFGLDPQPVVTAAPQPVQEPVSEPDPIIAANAREKFYTPLGKGNDTVTIMVYMCGTDLESKYGMATSDLSEMVKANLSDKVNLIVETGGCKAWKNSVISSSKNQIYRVHQGGLERLEDNFGTKAMTDPDNLRDFIKYCNKNYPANRNILIFWDHGGGSISGFGYDEKSGSSASMGLTKINRALTEANVKFDWIGFDACLMSTLETAQVCGNFADYLIASEEVEPGTGWYYTDWLNELSANTSVPTLELSRGLIDDYVKACRASSYSAQVTLAVTDLAELQGTVPPLFREFSTATNELISGSGYKQVSDARAGARQFSQSSRINQVDLCDLALRIGSDEAEDLAKAIQACVKYNGTTISRCYGLSIYFPYETLNTVSTAVNTYEELGIDSEYTKCIKSFASLGYGGQIGSSASQSPAYGGSSYGGSWSDWGQLFESYYGSSSGSYGGSSYGSSYGSSSGSYSSYEDLLGSLIGGYSGSSSPLGALSGNYYNAGGSQSAGYSLDASDLAGLLSAFSGRSMPAGYEWVDTRLIADSADKIAANYIDPGRITASYKNGQPVLSLSEEEWALIQTVELNLFVEDGDGYIDLGLDNVFEFDGNDLILAHDNTWLCVDGQVAAYYLVSDVQNADGSWTTTGRIPALVNGEFMNLQVIFDNANPYGAITGAYPLYENGETQTQAKGCIPLQPGDRVEFLCDFYGYDGSYGASYTLGTGFVVEFTDFYLENLRLDGVNTVASYKLTDIYGNSYWLSF